MARFDVDMDLEDPLRRVNNDDDGSGRDAADRVVRETTVFRDTSPISSMKEYDPTTSDMDEWINKFERALRLGNIKESQYVDWLHFKIGDIGVAAVDDWDDTYEEIITKLREEFRMDRRSLEAQSKLNKLVKGDMSWEKFGAKAKQVAAIASEGSEQLKEHLTIQVLQNNMDFELRQQVMNVDHVKSSQVLRRIAQVESLSKQKLLTTKTEESPNDLEKKIKELEKKFDNAKISQVTKKPQKQVRCWNCNGIGHVMRDCNKRKMMFNERRWNRQDNNNSYNMLPQFPRNFSQQQPQWQYMQPQQIGYTNSPSGNRSENVRYMCEENSLN